MGTADGNTGSELTWKGACGVAAAVLIFSWSLTTHGKFSATGDEPHYLMIAESLRSDGDLDLANNYGQNDGRLFGHDSLPMELHAAPALSGDIRSIHALGLAVFVLPVYAVAQQLAGVVSEDLLRSFRMSRGLFVYSIVSLSLIALTAFGLALLAIGLSNICGPRRAKAIAIIVGISPPVLSHSFLIFPEVFALSVSCCVVWFSTRHRRDNDPAFLVPLLLSVGVLPWFHQKYFVCTFGLLMVLGWRRYDLLRTLTPARAAIGLIAFAGPQLASLLWLHHEWGTFGGALTTGLLTPQAIPLTVDSFNRGAVGLLFDRQSGLAAFAPLFWIVPASIVLTWKKTWYVLVPVLLLYAPAAAFVIGWWAGFSPAARYLVPAVPLLTIPVAFALHHRVVRNVAMILVAWQLILDAVIWQHPRWLWPGTDHNQVLEGLWLPGRMYSALLLAVRTDGLTAQAMVPIALAVALTTTVVLFARIDGRRQNG